MIGKRLPDKHHAAAKLPRCANRRDATTHQSTPSLSAMVPARRHLRLAALLFLIVLPMSGMATEIFWDLRTNYVPGTEFSRVRVEVIDTVDNRKSWHSIKTVNRTTDTSRLIRIGEFDHIESGRRYWVVIELLDSRMRPVDGRLVSLIGPRRDGFFATVITRPR